MTDPFCLRIVEEPFCLRKRLEFLCEKGKEVLLNGPREVERVNGEYAWRGGEEEYCRSNDVHGADDE